PAQIMPLVNMSIAYARTGENTKAEESLTKALAIEPKNAEAQFNMGLLKAEQGDSKQAEFHLQQALENDPSMAEAAYNLGVLLADEDPKQSITLCRNAYKMRPNNFKYGYTLAFYESRAGDTEAAIEILQALIRENPAHADAYALLGDIYERAGKLEDAEKVYQEAATSEAVPAGSRSFFADKIKTLRTGN
ncbi:MAG: tetratricopeptide repeat protein, partial [Desulfoferrobacter sp.]